jgi:transcriptional regulator with XRE-family HTH domain
MENQPIAAVIRSKKLGILIRGARTSADKSLEQCAGALNISSEQFAAFEQGEISPSLPQLELLAYFLKTPLDYFWGRDVLDPNRDEPKEFERERLMRLRNRMIGAILRKARLEAGMTSLELASLVNLSEEQLTKYELGEEPIPLPTLEMLANHVNSTIKEFQDNRGPIGRWLKQQRAMQHFDDLSPELQEFISKPINRPYLEISQRLSEMSVEKLRTVAEGLLEITL